MANINIGYIKINGRIKTNAKDGVALEATQAYDTDLGKTQAELNAQFAAGLNAVDTITAHSLGDGDITIDNLKAGDVYICGSVTKLTISSITASTRTATVSFMAAADDINIYVPEGYVVVDNTKFFAMSEGDTYAITAYCNIVRVEPCTIGSVNFITEDGETVADADGKTLNAEN